MTNSIAKIEAGKSVAAIVPTNLDELWRVAQLFAMGGLGPTDLKGKPEAVATVLMYGLELGLKPMFALSTIYIVNGRPTVWGAGIPALLRLHGYKLKEWIDGEGDSMCAYCQITSPEGEADVRTFSMADAKAAGLLSKPGPWQQYRKRMLGMRARGFAVRDLAPEAVAGLYLAEEAQDIADPVPLQAIDEGPQDDGPPDPDAPEPVEVVEDPDPPLTADWVEHYRDEITMMPPHEREEYREMNLDAAERLSPELRAEWDAINAELIA